MAKDVVTKEQKQRRKERLAKNIQYSAQGIGTLLGFYQAYRTKGSFWSYPGWGFLGSISLGVISNIATRFTLLNDPKTMRVSIPEGQGKAPDVKMEFAGNKKTLKRNGNSGAGNFGIGMAYMAKDDCISSGGELINHGRQCKWGHNQTAMIDEF